MRIARVIVMLLAVAACSGAPVAVEPGSYLSGDVTFASRGVEIPATFVRPGTATGERYPVVVMAHGHGGNRDEAGSFVSWADDRSTSSSAPRPAATGLRHSSPPGASTRRWGRNGSKTWKATGRWPH